MQKSREFQEPCFRVCPCPAYFTQSCHSSKNVAVIVDKPLNPQQLPSQFSRSRLLRRFRHPEPRARPGRTLSIRSGSIDRPGPALLPVREEKRLAQQLASNLAAYDSFLEGQRLAKMNSQETNVQAQTAYRKAIESDPGYGRAYGALAYTLA